MKARVVLVASLWLLLSASVARPGTVPIGIQGGASVPTGDLAKSVGDGYHFGLFIAYLPDSLNGFELDANYHVLTEKTSTIDAFFVPLTFKQNATILEGLLCFRIALVPKGVRAVPYLKGGFGVELTQTQVTFESTESFTSSESRAWLGAVAGAGLSLPLGAVSGVRVEGLFHLIQTDTEATEMYTIALGFWTKAGKR